MGQRERIKTALRSYFEEHRIAALAFPATHELAPKIGEEAGVYGRNSGPGSCASMASLVLPTGLTTNGMPVGMEFAGLSGTDREMLALGLSIEKALKPIPPPKIYRSEAHRAAPLLTFVKNQRCRQLDQPFCANSRSRHDGCSATGRR
jgi:Asp-tRNA(Asn)/Glu-tRNA(Gln) amidotransferase A subunit family amidase